MTIAKNSIVFVTGANRGIGKSIVETFIKEGASKVYAAARDMDTLGPLIANYGEKVVPIKVDLNDPATITQAAKIASDVDIVINNAGTMRIKNPLADNAIAALQQEMETNVYGLMRVAKAFAPILNQNGGGVFAQINSVASIKNFADFSTYSASKAASYSITQGIRDKLKAQGTHVVSVHPGPIDTDMANDAGMGDIAEPAALVPQSLIAAIDSGAFHAYPDSMAKNIGEAYQSFAASVVEANLMEG